MIRNTPAAVVTVDLARFGQSVAASPLIGDDGRARIASFLGCCRNAARRRSAVIRANPRRRAQPPTRNLGAMPLNFPRRPGSVSSRCFLHFSSVHFRAWPFSRRLNFQGILPPPCKLLTLLSLHTMRKPLLLFAHLAILRGCLGKCYYPDGTPAPGDIPCDPDAENSACCSAKSGDAFGCLANKLCRMPSGRNVRGSCTDPTWMSPECPKFCMSTSPLEDI